MLKSGIYDFVICRGGIDMCFVLGFGRQRPDLKQYRISGLTFFWFGDYSVVGRSLDTSEGLGPVTSKKTQAELKIANIHSNSPL